MKTQKNGKSVREPPLLYSCRLNLFILFLFATLNIMLFRSNINFGLVCMVKAPHLHHHAQNQTQEQNDTKTTIQINFTNITINEKVKESAPGETTLDLENYEDMTSEESNYGTCQPPPIDATKNHTPRTETGEFDWDKGTQASILGAFFYGYIFTNILGGWVADKYGGRKSLIASVASISILTILNPIAALQGPAYLFTVRFLQGISNGAFVPLISVLGARWAGHTERGFLMGIAFGGFNIAIFAANPFSAFICKNLGWSYIFYISGGMGILWCIISHFLIYDWPEDHPRISQQELEFLQKNRAVQPGIHNSKKLIVPWREIIFSVPVNVIHFVHVCVLWGVLTLAMCTPPFFREVLKMDVRTNGLLTSIPFLGMLIVHCFSGSVFDAIRRRNYFSVTTLRKIFNTFGTASFALCLPLMSLIPCTDNMLAIVSIFSGMSFLELSFVGGYLFSIYELAPRFSGILTGISNTFGVLPGFVCPALAAYLTQNGTREEWLLVFYIGAAVCGAGSLAYLLFGSSELQPWADLKPKLTNGSDSFYAQSTVEDAEMVVLQKKLVNSVNGGDDEILR